MMNFQFLIVSALLGLPQLGFASEQWRCVDDSYFSFRLANFCSLGAQAQSASQQVIELLAAKTSEQASLSVDVVFDDGFYSMRYRKTGTEDRLACPQGGNLIVPVGVEVELTITSTDKIVRWTLPIVGLDMLAIPGRLESQRFVANMPGIFQVRPPSGNTDKVSDIPLDVMSVGVFDIWFDGVKPCR